MISKSALPMILGMAALSIAFTPGMFTSCVSAANVQEGQEIYTETTDYPVWQNDHYQYSHACFEYKYTLPVPFSIRCTETISEAIWYNFEITQDGSYRLLYEIENLAAEDVVDIQIYQDGNGKLFETQIPADETPTEVTLSAGTYRLFVDPSFANNSSRVTTLSFTTDGLSNIESGSGNTAAADTGTENTAVVSEPVDEGDIFFIDVLSDSQAETSADNQSSQQANSQDSQDSQNSGSSDEQNSAPADGEILTISILDDESDPNESSNSNRQNTSNEVNDSNEANDSNEVNASNEVSDPNEANESNEVSDPNEVNDPNEANDSDDQVTAGSDQPSGSEAETEQESAAAELIKTSNPLNSLEADTQGYYEFIRKDLLPVRGFASLDMSSNDLYNDTAFKHLYWDKRSGLIGADIVDLNQDGTEDLLVYSLLNYRHAEFEYNTEYSPYDCDTGLFAELYTRDDNGDIVLVRREHIMDSRGIHLSYNGLGIMYVDEKPYLYIENVSDAYFANGGSIAYDLYEYEGGGAFTPKWTICKSDGGSASIAHSYFERQSDGTMARTTLEADGQYRMDYPEDSVEFPLGTPLQEAITYGFSLIGLPASANAMDIYGVDVSYGVCPTYMLESYVYSSIEYLSIGTPISNGRYMTITLSDETQLRERIEELGGDIYDETEAASVPVLTGAVDDGLIFDLTE